MRLDADRWRRKRGVERILAALEAAQGMTRYVGGAVRDDLLGQPVSDIDFATRLRPEQVIEKLEAAHIKSVPTGIEHGTITAIADGQPAEVTTLRADVSTDGRRATVAFTDDWMADASRRDFTINALYADPESGEIHDYFGGLEDLQAGRVRFIGDPLIRIAEDHLRILRFFRFHGRFGAGEPDAAALEACTARANDLMALSRERIADELLKLLALPNPGVTVALMIAHGILLPVLPEIESAERLELLIAAEAKAGLEPDPLRRLAALLPQDPDAAEKIAARLKLSNRARRRAGIAAGTDLSDSPQALAYWLGTESAQDRLLLADRPQDAAGLTDWPVPRLPIRGGQLIKLGVPEGPLVAKTLQEIERQWVAAGFPGGDAFKPIVDSAIADA